MEDKDIGLPSQLQETSGRLETWTKGGVHLVVSKAPMFFTKFRCRSTKAMVGSWTTWGNRSMTGGDGSLRFSPSLNWKRPPQRVLKLFIWPIFERSVSGPGWKTALNCRVSISETLQFCLLHISRIFITRQVNLLHLLAGVWRNADCGFLPWRVEWQALTMTLAIRCQLMAILGNDSQVAIIGNGNRVVGNGNDNQ